MKFADANDNAIPAYCVGKDSLVEKSKTLDAVTRGWIKKNSFLGSFGQSIICPTESDGIVALLGLGDEHSRKRSRFSLAAAAKSLPPGNYEILNPEAVENFEIEVLGWLINNYIFDKYKIKPPKSFDELFQVCETLKNDKEIESPISWPANRGQPLATSFILAMANYGKPYINLRHIGQNIYDLDSEKILLKTNFLSEASFQAAKMLKKLLNYSPKNISYHSNDECVEYYSKGKSAMVMNWSSRAHLFELNNKSPAFKKTGYLPRPAGHPSFQVSPIGGFSLGVPANIPNEKIPFIMKNIRNFVSPEFIKYYIEHGSLSSPVFSVVNDPEVRALRRIFNEIDKMEKEEKRIEWGR